MILDPMFPAHKSCSADSANTIFGRRFGITCKISDKKCLIQRVINDEMWRKYYIQIRNDNYVINAQSDILEDLLTLIIPRKFQSDIMKDSNRSNNMLDYFKLGNNTQCDTT